jgi:hypothetical protein
VPEVLLGLLLCAIHDHAFLIGWRHGETPSSSSSSNTRAHNKGHRVQFQFNVDTPSCEPVGGMRAAHRSRTYMKVRRFAVRLHEPPCQYTSPSLCHTHCNPCPSSMCKVITGGVHPDFHGNRSTQHFLFIVRCAQEEVGKTEVRHTPYNCYHNGLQL